MLDACRYKTRQRKTAKSRCNVLAAYLYCWIDHLHEIQVRRLSEQKRPIELRDWAEVLGKSFSEGDEYSTTFACDSEIIGRECIIDLGEVLYVCEVILNGQNLGTRLRHPYRLSATGYLKAGTNEINIIVANTMANQYVNTDVFDDWLMEKTGPYHAKALEFEKNTAFSGLYGLVQIRW